MLKLVSLAYQGPARTTTILRGMCPKQTRTHSCLRQNVDSDETQFAMRSGSWKTTGPYRSSTVVVFQALRADHSFQTDDGTPQFVDVDGLHHCHARSDGGFDERRRDLARGDIDFADCAPKLKQVNRSEEHTSELQSPCNLVCRLLLEKKKKNTK